MKETLRTMRAKRAEGDRGFTLIELLVVVVIIGILVAIAIPVYMNYRAGAADKAAQSDVRGGITAVESYYTQNGNTYPDDTGTAQIGPPSLVFDANTKITISEGTTLTYINNGDGTYLLCARNSGGNNGYLYESETGGSPREVETLDVADCTE